MKDIQTNNKSPLISVIVPVYNVEEYLDRCLKSICNQTYNNIEIILVNDGSKDNSGEKCNLWKTKDERIVVIHKENGGLSDARNYGINVSNGDYITFVDSDDIISEELIKYLYNLLTQNDAQISICDPVHCVNNENINFQNDNKQIIYNSDEAICKMLYQKSFLPSAWGKLFSKKLFNDIKFPYGMLFEDVAIMYKLFAISSRIVYGNAKLYGYVHRENSITTKKFSIKDCDIIKIYKEQLNFAKLRSIKVYDAALAYAVVGSFRVYLNAPRNGQFDKEIEECKLLIQNNWKKVFCNRNIRKKLRVSLILFKFYRPVMKWVYRKVDRWK